MIEPIQMGNIRFMKGDVTYASLYFWALQDYFQLLMSLPSITETQKVQRSAQFERDSFNQDGNYD
jgi:hypothetical protein